MGELVCDQIGDAVRCLFAGDSEGAAAIGARDAEVNRLDSEIDGTVRPCARTASAATIAAKSEAMSAMTE